MVAVKLLRFELLGLKASFTGMVFAFPPPNMTDISNISAEVQKLGEENQDSTIEIVGEVFSHLQETLPKDIMGRLQALRDVVLSYLFPDVYPWDKTLEAVDDLWPTWGAPWLLAAKSCLEGKCYDKALDYILSAERLLFVGDGYLISIVDKLRKDTIGFDSRKIKKRDINLEANLIITRHKPTVINFDRYASRAKIIKKRDAFRNAIEKCLKIHGNDPKEWFIEKDYSELSSAGGMCMYVNMVAILSQTQDHDFTFWNHTAIGFLKKSLSVERPKDPSKSLLDVYPLTRLCETYANMVAYKPQVFSEEEAMHDLEQIEDYATYLAQESISRVYGMMRKLTRIYQSKARFLQMNEASQEEIYATIEKAERFFEGMMTYAYPNLPAKPKIAKDFSKFLADFGHFDKAKTIADQYFGDCGNLKVLVEVASKYKAGSRKSAVKELTRTLKDEKNAKHILGYANLLVFYIQKMISDGATIKKSVIASARKEIKNKIGVLIKSCVFFIDNNRVDQAYRYFKVLEWADGDDLSGNVVHLGARINLLKVKAEHLTADEAASWILAKLNKKPSLKNDPYLGSILLSTYAQGASIQLDSQTLRKLIANISKTPDVVNLYDMLKWQIASGNLDNWAENFLHAVKEFPNDPKLLNLPIFLWENNSEEASSILLKIFLKSFEETDLQPHMVEVCRKLPGDFFFASEVTSKLFSKLNTPWEDEQVWKRYLGAFISGLCRGQIDSWYDPDLCKQRSIDAAKWINRCLPQVGVWKWTQWLGTGRGDFARRIVANLTDGIKVLHNSLGEAGLTCGEWIEQLASFLSQYRTKTDLTCADLSCGSQKWSKIQDYCVDAASRYCPDKQVSSCWAGLNQLVRDWYSDIKTDQILNVLPNIWISVHQNLEMSTTESIVKVVNAPVHDFKNHIKAEFNLSDELPSTRKDMFNNVVEKTLEHLNFHRYPAFGRVNLCDVLADAAFDLPFVQTKKKDNVWSLQPRLYAIRPKQPVEVLADRKLLVEAVKSLLMNSTNHTDSRKLKGWIWAEVFHEDGYGGIRIIDSGREDNGKAVSPNIIELLNDPNAKPFSSTGSTGYGTRLCHRIVKAHGGSLTFAPGPAHIGLKVEIHIPLFI